MASGNGTVQSRQGMNGNYQKNNVVEIDLSALAIYSFKHWRVLIESKSSSKISDIREEISEIGKIGKNLAGIILVD